MKNCVILNFQRNSSKVIKKFKVAVQPAASAGISGENAFREYPFVQSHLGFVIRRTMDILSNNDYWQLLIKVT